MYYIPVEALGRRKDNLATADGILEFLFESSQEQSSSSFGHRIFEAVKTKIQQQRNIELVTLAKFLKNPTIFENYHEIDIYQ